MKAVRWPAFLAGTLRRQLILAVAGVHAVMMVAFVWDYTARQKALLLERQTEQTHALAQSIATSAAGWVAARDFYGLQEIVAAQTRYPELRFAMILDRQGRVRERALTMLRLRGEIDQRLGDPPPIVDLAPDAQRLLVREDLGCLDTVLAEEEAALIAGDTRAVGDCLARTETLVLKLRLLETSRETLVAQLT